MTYVFAWYEFNFISRMAGRLWVNDNIINNIEFHKRISNDRLTTANNNLIRARDAEQLIQDITY